MVATSKTQEPKQNDTQNNDTASEKAPQGGLTRRDFLKLSAGAAVVAAAASQLIPSLGIPSADAKSPTDAESAGSRLASTDSGPAIVFVEGDRMRIFSGENETTVRDARLASSLVRKFA